MEKSPLKAIINSTEKLMARGYTIKAGKWQGTDSYSTRDMVEILNEHVSILIPWGDSEFIQQKWPDQPWAENHFRERVEGVPVNPGETYKEWPYNTWGDSDEFLKDGKFSHTYMERYWDSNNLTHIIDILCKNPETRQAFLGVWDIQKDPLLSDIGERVPCTLGYHFIIRGGYLHCNYYIRSCDILRHFHNDVYLTLRLCQWINDKIPNAGLGVLNIYITSLHYFKNDEYLIKKRLEKWDNYL